MQTRLSPVQDQALQKLLEIARPGRTVMLLGSDGMGKTEVLRAAHAVLGGVLLTPRKFMESMEGRHPLALEETFYRVLREALAAQPVVILDDLHLLSNVMCCTPFYPRQNFLNAALTPLADQAEAAGKRLVFGTENSPFAALWTRAQRAEIESLAAGDYRVICEAYLGTERAGGLDFEKIHRFARKLNARQLRHACESLPDPEAVDTDGLIDHLRAHHLASNVDLGEVQEVDLRHLKGMDDLLRTLEANVVLPLENSELAAELGLAPKRGVLLAGPPGTGKTTIGRALAHRLKSKFFLVDGTVIAGTGGFYARIQHIFESAMQNAPAIVFIDDSDVIFESGSELGLYRYLLTILDGLESESAGGICLMMTAMDVGNLPPALVRSGRIELWLETRLPDQEARIAILEERCAALPAAMGEVDIPRLARATEGLSGADLTRLIEDGKLLFAYDRAQGHPTRPAVEYFLAAVETVRSNKERYAQAEALARERRPARPPYFEVYGDMLAAQNDVAIGFDFR